MKQTRERKGVPCSAHSYFLNVPFTKLQVSQQEYETKQGMETGALPCPNFLLGGTGKSVRVWVWNLKCFIVRWGSYFGQIFFSLSLRMTQIHFYGKKLINVCWAFPRPISCATIMMFLSSFFWQTQCSKFLLSSPDRTVEPIPIPI